MDCKGKEDDGQMRDVEVEMRMNEKEGDVVAYGTVTVDACIRFPLRIRKYVDKEDGKEKSFVSFPRRKTGDGWEDAVRPEPERREQIINAAWEAVKRDFSKDLNLPEVEEVDVTPLPDPYAGAARARIVGVATVSVCGLTIRGITVKEGEHGLFVNMPQYRTEDGKYKDLVYGTSRRMQEKIARAVLEAYRGVME